MSRRPARAAAVAAMFLAVSTATAHPIHTTFTAVSVQQGVVTLTVRTFADDFSASVAALAGKTPPPDWAVTDAEVARYLAAHLQVVDARGTSRVLRSCGIRRERDVYLVCVRVDGVSDVRGLRAQNTILIERHADQVNIVQVDVGGARRTLLFTRRSAALSLSD